jgi:hypothetical protein
LKSLVAVTAMLVAAVQVASAQAAAAATPARQPILLGTTGACHNLFPGGPCTETSALVQLDPQTGQLIREIGPVGYTVNGLAWDPTNGKLYASTSIGCGPDLKCPFHGLITINPFTGAGTPVDPAATNFGLAGNPSPIHSVVVNPLGQMVGWYDEKPAPGVTDTFVKINKRTGVATEFNNTGLDTNQNGLAFQAFGPFSILWNIDSPKVDPVTLAVVPMTAYVINPFNGHPLVTRHLPLVTADPPATGTCSVPAFFCDGHAVAAALGDFNPVDHRYYGLDFPGGRNVPDVGFVQVDPIRGTVKLIGPALDNLHVLAFVKHRDD